jgi:hypothetical protein
MLIYSIPILPTYMNDEEKLLKKRGVLLYSNPGVGRFSSIVYLINLLSALHISEEIRKRWTDGHHTLT